MRSEARPGVQAMRGDAARGWTREDFKRRAEPETLPELMDEPCTVEELTACLRDLARVNRWTRSYPPVLAFLRRARERQGDGGLRVLDVGAGYGDTLRAVYRWAARRRMRVQLTGIDLNARSAEIAREATRRAGLPADAIVWRTGDAFAMGADETGGASADVVMSSLVAHHLGRAELVKFVRWMERYARVGWLVSDLERQWLPAVLFGLLARAMRWHRFVRHDGPVSFRRALRVEDWEEVLREAGIARGDVRIVKRFPARICVERQR